MSILAGRRRVAVPLGGLIAADVISTAGTEMSAVALPWFVLSTTGSPTQMGAVLAAEFAGLSLLGLVGGRVATRLGPRRTMLSSDLIRAALIGSIPLLSYLGWLTFPLILGIAFVLGSFFPAYQSSGRLIVAALVEDDELRLTRVGGLLNAVNESASFVGPALGGILVVLLGPGPVLLLDAATYACAFALVGLLVRGVHLPAHGADEDSSILFGLRYLWRDPRLRRLIAGVGLAGIGFAAMVATVPVYARHEYGEGGASVAGWLLGAYGAGSVIGGLISSRARRVGGPLPAIAMAGLAAATWIMLLPVPAWVVGVAIGGVGVGSGLFYPRFFGGLTARTPPALRARVLTAVTIAISAPGPIGFLGAGWLAQHWSAMASFTLVAVAATVGAIVVASAYQVLEAANADGAPGANPGAPPA